MRKNIILLSLENRRELEVTARPLQWLHLICQATAHQTSEVSRI